MPRNIEAHMKAPGNLIAFPAARTFRIVKLAILQESLDAN